MTEMTIDGADYRTTKLNALQAFHLMRKLMPLFGGFGATSTAMAPASNGEIPSNFWTSLGPVAQAIANMSNEDSETILMTCLSVCQRRTPVGTWAKLTSPDGQHLMFEDMELGTMLQISFAVLQENLAGFFGGQGAGNGSDRDLSLGTP